MKTFFCYEEQSCKKMNKLSTCTSKLTLLHHPQSKYLWWFLEFEASWGIFTPPEMGIASPLQGSANIKLAGTHLYTSV